jgi:lipoate-protein ligase A
MEGTHWRFLDTGVLSAAENMAIDEMLLQLKAKKKIPNTVRLLQFDPPAILVGFHQAVEQETRFEYCKEMGIDINRRITGGGAIYFDKSQIGWEIIFDKNFFTPSIPGTELFKKLSMPIINMLNRIGIKANFRGRNDIEVNGRKISGTGGTEWGDAFLFQGTLLVDFDVDSMLKALRVPVEKLKRHEIDSLKERVTCIKWELGYTPDTKRIKRMIRESFEEYFKIKFYDSQLSEEEESLLKDYLKKFQSEQWIYRIRLPVSEQPIIYTTRVSKFGKIKGFFTVNLRRHRIQSVIFMGDFFSFPNEVVYNLESSLKEIPLEQELINRHIMNFFTNYKKWAIPDAEIADFLKLIDSLFQKLKMVEYGIKPELTNHIFLVNGSYEEIINLRPSHILLPYCAKSTDCPYRYIDDCTMCGECSIGKAYKMAFDHNLKPITITSYECLIKTLRFLKNLNISAYIGCCCEQFYIKHQKAFESAKIPAILLDIDSTTCYDLGKANYAYKGEFENQTQLNLMLLKKVLDEL